MPDGGIKSKDKARDNFIPQSGTMNLATGIRK